LHGTGVHDRFSHRASGHPADPHHAIDHRDVTYGAIDPSAPRLDVPRRLPSWLADYAGARPCGLSGCLRTYRAHGPGEPIPVWCDRKRRSGGPCDRRPGRRWQPRKALHLPPNACSAGKPAFFGCALPNDQPFSWCVAWSGGEDWDAAGAGPARYAWEGRAGRMV